MPSPDYSEICSRLEKETSLVLNKPANKSENIPKSEIFKKSLYPAEYFLVIFLVLFFKPKFVYIKTASNNRKLSFQKVSLFSFILPIPLWICTYFLEKNNILFSK